MTAVEMTIQTEKFESTYISYGEQNSQKILYLHGNPGNKLDIPEQSLKEIGLNFHIVSFDRPGHGKSKSKEYGLSINEFAIQNLSSHLGWKQFILLAHSWSAALALSYASKHPEQISVLFLVNPWVFPRPEEEDSSMVLNLLKLPGSFSLLESKIESQIRSHFEKCFAPSKAPESFMESHRLSKQNVQAMLADKKSLLESFSKIVEVYPQVQTKTIILAAKDDQITAFESQADKLFQILPNASLISEPKGGHAFPYTENSPMIQNLNLLKEETRRAANQSH